MIWQMYATTKNTILELPYALVNELVDDISPQVSNWQLYVVQKKHYPRTVLDSASIHNIGQCLNIVKMREVTYSQVDVCVIVKMIWQLYVIQQKTLF